MEKGCREIVLTEASLGRVLQHVQGKAKTKRWGVITAYRYANTPAENKALNKDLETTLRVRGYGFFKVEGHWQECQDKNVNYHDCPKDKLVNSTEISFFVPQINPKELHEIGNRYGQDAVLYGGEETKGNGVLIFKNGKVENVGKMHPGSIQQAYTKMRNSDKVFSFQRDKYSKKKMPSISGSSAEKTDKLLKLLPKDILNKTVKNPETGRVIKVASALRYDDDSHVKKNAMSLVKMMQKQKS